MNQIQAAAFKRFPPKEADLRPGDTVRAHIQIQEGEKSRLQIFEGVVLKIQGHASSRSFTVRKISHGVGAEKTIPLSSPRLQKVEIAGRAKVRRARLFYLRERKGRQSRLKAKKGALLSEWAERGASKASAAESLSANPPLSSAAAKAAAAIDGKGASNANKGPAANKPSHANQKP